MIWVISRLWARLCAYLNQNLAYKPSTEGLNFRSVLLRRWLHMRIWIMFIFHLIWLVLSGRFQKRDITETLFVRICLFFYLRCQEEFKAITSVSVLHHNLIGVTFFFSELMLNMKVGFIFWSYSVFSIIYVCHAMWTEIFSCISITEESCNWNDINSVALRHWKCGYAQLEAATINH